MLYREPENVPLKPGIFALVNRKRRYVYVSWTSNLQKRSHSISHMLLQQDDNPKAYWPLKDMPKHKSDEYVFMVMNSRTAKPENALALITNVQKQFEAKGYRIISGHRAGSPVITLAGNRITLSAAVKQTGKVKYLTAYRRLERGWTPEQALGLAPPAPRWHIQKQQARAKREAARG